MNTTKTFYLVLVYGLVLCGLLWFARSRYFDVRVELNRKWTALKTNDGQGMTTTPTELRASSCHNATRNFQTPTPELGKVKTVPEQPAVINPHPFNFTLPGQRACFNRMNSRGELFLVLLVKCAPYEKLDREQIRKTWGGVEEVLGRRVLTMFLLGESTDPVIRKEIQEEDGRFHDLIQEDFIDNYQNLTYKNMMGLKWVSMYCPQTSFVFSVDADMMINIVTLVKRLATSPKTDFAEGHLRTNVIVERKKRSKWYIPKEVYANPRYPPFLNGACYAMSRDVAVRVFHTSKYVPFLRLDDAFVGILMKKIGVTPRLSTMYEQYSKKFAEAMEKGIGVGILHNRRQLNVKMLNLWHKTVGSQIKPMDKTRL